ncbi:hypothetical protein B0T44_05595 [Nocardia donostiensis]|uniref:Uncharacterized protein n=1 Tax=Nocardia donostiensis TaxID=1538463 RepID=A0A1W0BIH2_9NOCA|nr:hypothetical protein B0T46_05945 [Nocardia donostiensis]OQS22136.1 hypothetical protein B0T44_05595 [Nocardia donostiensis]
MATKLDNASVAAGYDCGPASASSRHVRRWWNALARMSPRTAHRVAPQPVDRLRAVERYEQG